MTSLPANSIYYYYFISIQWSISGLSSLYKTAFYKLSVNLDVFPHPTSKVDRRGNAIILLNGIMVFVTLFILYIGFNKM